jgi:hypothetical protein
MSIFTTTNDVTDMKSFNNLEVIHTVCRSSTIDSVYHRLGKIHSFCLVWRAVILVISCFLIAFAYWQRHAMLYNDYMAGQINDILQYVSLSLTSLVVIVETFRKQAQYLEIRRIIS